MTPEELNLREYERTDLSIRITPECDLLHEYLEDAFQVGRNALEIGPGNGRTAAYLLSQGMNLDIVEYNADVLNALKQNLERLDLLQMQPLFSRCTIEEFELPPNNYSLISASHVLHFLEPDKLWVVLERLRASLRTGGVLLFRGHSSKDSFASEEQDYVKHFFQLSDFDWFKDNGFTCMYFSEVRAKPSVRSAKVRAAAEGYPDDFAFYLQGEQVHFDAVFKRDS